MCHPGPAAVRGNDWADRLVGKAAITSGLCLERFAVLKNLRHYIQAQSQGHHTIDCLEERSIERGSNWHWPLKWWGRAIVKQSNTGTVSETTLVALLRNGLECIDTKHLELKWPKLTQTEERITYVNWRVSKWFTDGAHMGFSERRDTMHLELKWPELTQTEERIIYVNWRVSKWFTDGVHTGFPERLDTMHLDLNDLNWHRRRKGSLTWTDMYQNKLPIFYSWVFCTRIKFY